MIMHQAQTETKDAEVIEKVAQVLSALDDYSLEVIGASSTRASEALQAAAKKAARARSEEHAREKALETVALERGRAKARLDAIEAELEDIRRGRSDLDEWVSEQRTNALRRERSDLRPQLQHLEKVLAQRRPARR